MRHGLFRTNRDGKGRVAASSHRFTPSILKLLDYTRRERGTAGWQAGRQAEAAKKMTPIHCRKSNIVNVKVKKEELQSLNLYVVTFLFFFFFLIVLHQRGNCIGRYSEESLQVLRKYRGRRKVNWSPPPFSIHSQIVMTQQTAELQLGGAGG